jgi:hypothetical protein
MSPAFKEVNAMRHELNLYTQTRVAEVAESACANHMTNGPYLRSVLQSMMEQGLDNLTQDEYVRIFGVFALEPGTWRIVH